ncbi:hypothetical protein Cs7R123_74860 [Catellatospora sp. TT07R-123]|nr:hypothetical protein Cs7R123_74860 [Catellatospora sp. TT07R-123]
MVVSSGWWFLVAMIAAYGIANLLQSMAATRTATTDNLDPGLLLRLFGNKTYLLGLGCQILGFFLALGARRDLPLFLVQSAVTAGLCVTAFCGVVLLKWKLPLAEISLLTLVVAGIGMLAASAKPGHAEPLDAKGIISLVVALAAIAAVSVVAGKVKGVLGSVVLGSLAGLCFASAAIAARPLASAQNIVEFGLNPLLYLVIAHSLTGQLLLGLAMQRGSTNAAVAAMDAAGAVPAAAIGMLLLGDQIRSGMVWVAALGFVLTLGAVIALTRFAEPQHDLVAEPVPLPVRRTSASVPGLPPHPARGVFQVPGASQTVQRSGDEEADVAAPTAQPVAPVQPVPATQPIPVPQPAPSWSPATHGYATQGFAPAAAFGSAADYAPASNGHHPAPTGAYAPAQANGHPAPATPGNGHSTPNGHGGNGHGTPNGHGGNGHSGQHGYGTPGGFGAGHEPGTGQAPAPQVPGQPHPPVAFPVTGRPAHS